jgi:hypothetical protein
MEARLESGLVRLSHEHSEFSWLSIAQLPQLDLPKQYLAFAANYDRKK